MALQLEKNEVVREEIADFRKVLADFEAGTIPDTTFQKRRLWQGIYGQRQLGVQMIRIKVPYGIISTDQVRCIGDQARKRSNGVLHLTTRQAIQIHHIPRIQCGDLIDELADAGLTSREACGNTVRAVTGDYLAGIGADQVFDFRPVAERLFHHCLRNPYSQNFPRKFKITFSGSDLDRGLSLIHDIGYIATVKDGVRGFRVVAAGGLGSQPFPAETVEEFLPVSQVLLSATALIRLFNTHGNRKQRNKARMKYVKEKLGLVEFRRVYRGFFDELADSDYGRSLLLDESSLGLDLAPSRGTLDGLVVEGAPETWTKENILPQIEPDLFTVLVRVELGDIHADVSDKLADLVDRLGARELRTTPDQNLVITNVPRANLAALYTGLAELGLASTGFSRLSNVLACPGRSTCNLSMTSSKGLAVAIREELERRPELDVPGTIKISGCPNSCGQHHIASIGFHGLAVRSNGKPAPFAQVMLGGSATGEFIRLARRSLRVPTKKAPKVVTTLVDLFLAERSAGQGFDAWIGSVSDERAKEILAPLGVIETPEEAPEMYRDWDSETKDYNPAMGQGECAGGVIDLVNEALADGENTLRMARQLIESGFWVDAVKNVREAAGHVFRAGLSNAGEETVSYAEDLSRYLKFYGSNEALPEISEFLREGTVPSSIDEKAARELVADAALFIEGVVEVYRWKPANFKPAALVETSEGGHLKLPLLDLKGVGCPMNYVKVKLKLETMAEGAELEVIIDAGEPFRMVPASLRNDGHEIVQLDPINDAEQYSMVVRKKA
ncbi:MAG: sulfurtransferase TusA family protein [Fibrobacteria bacterium]|nr:sulfurtransferase TusA family protein [Fibrobacteria bacterium]